MEIWKDIPGLEGEYQASRHGRIRSLDRHIINKNGHNMFFKGRLISGCKSIGYLKAYCKGRIYLIHRLIAITFIPNPENKPEINHINFIRSDNQVENLEWCTRLENILHAKINNKIPRGVNHPYTTLNEFQVRVIKKEHDLSRRELAEAFGVSMSNIKHIRTGYTWKHI